MLSQLMGAGLSLVLGTSAGVARAESGPDAVTKLWQARAALATQKLATGKLDACDRAVEEAFQRAKEDSSGKLRSFSMPLKAGSGMAVVTYFYAGQTRESFTVGVIPRDWVLMQRATSKTLSFAIGTACVFDLCTNNPTVDGPCPDDPRR